MTVSRRHEVDGGRQAGISADMGDKLKALERQNREILRKASAYFATADLDRRYKP